MNENVKKIEDFIRHFEALEVINLNSHKELGDADKQIANWYHRVEGTTITHVSQSHKLMKEIQTLLIKRRDLKAETISLRSTCDSLRAVMVKVKENYTNNIKRHKEVLEEAKNNVNGK